MKPHATVLTTASLLLAAGLAAAPAAPKFGVRGTIRSVTPATPAQEKKGVLGTLRVEGKKEPDTEADVAVVTVTRKTRLLGRDSSGARWESFGVGARVEARFRPGPRILIYPTRAEATELRLLSPAR